MDYSSLSPSDYSKLYDTALDVAEEYNKFLTKEVADALNLFVYEYSKSITLAWHLTPPDIDDVMQTVQERDTIHALCVELKRRGAQIAATDDIKKLDQKWQHQILEYIRAGEVVQPYYPRPNEPLDKWWMHIESLDTVSKKNLRTL